MNFCDFRRQCRENLGLTQRDMAEALKVDVPMYSRYERGQRSLREEHITTIATMLNIDYAVLRKIWIADKVFSVINSEEDATDILNIVAYTSEDKNEYWEYNGHNKENIVYGRILDINK